MCEHVCKCACVSGWLCVLSDGWCAASPSVCVCVCVRATVEVPPLELEEHVCNNNKKA